MKKKLTCLIIIFFLTNCGFLINQPTLYLDKNSKGRIEKNYFIYNDSTRNFISQSIFPESNVIIICIPGLGAYSGTYNSLQHYFNSKKISTVTLDLRNFGHWNGKKGDVSNIGLHISDINQVINYYKYKFHNKNIILLGESLGSSLAIWYNFTYPNKIDGLILTSIVTNHGEEKIRFKSVLKLLCGYIFYPNKPLHLDYNTNLYSNDTTFINWAFKIDTLGTNKISVRYLIQANKVIKESYSQLCCINSPILIMQGGKDFLSELKEIKKIINLCNKKNIQFEYFINNYHSLVNDINRVQIFNKMIKWIKENYWKK